MYNSTSTLKEDAMHPILSIADMGKNYRETIGGSELTFQ